MQSVSNTASTNASAKSGSGKPTSEWTGRDPEAIYDDSSDEDETLLPYDKFLDCFSERMRDQLAVHTNMVLESNSKFEKPLAIPPMVSSIDDESVILASDTNEQVTNAFHYMGSMLGELLPSSECEVHRVSVRSVGLALCTSIPKSFSSDIVNCIIIKFSLGKIIIYFDMGTREYSVYYVVTGTNRRAPDYLCHDVDGKSKYTTLDTLMRCVLMAIRLAGFDKLKISTDDVASILSYDSGVENTLSYEDINGTAVSL